MNKLFSKYQTGLLKLANNRFGRKLLHINEKKEIVGLTPSGYIIRAAKKDNFIGTFKTPFQYSQMIGSALTKWDIAKEYLYKSEYDLYRNLSDFKGLFHYVGLSNFAKLPIIALLDSTTKATSGASGRILNTESTWANARGGSTGDSVGVVGVEYTSAQSNGSYSCTRYFHSHDTTAIEGAIASVADVYLYSGQNNKTITDGSSNLVPTVSNQASLGSGLVVADFNDIDSLNSPSECSPRLSLSAGWNSAIGSEHQFTYDDATALSAIANGSGGWTLYTYRWSQDIDNSAPSGNNIIYPATGANSTDARRPKLIFTYEMPASSGNFLLQFLT